MCAVAAMRAVAAARVAAAAAARVAAVPAAVRALHLEDGETDDAQKVYEAGGGGDLAAERAREHRVHAGEAVRRPARRNRREGECREQRDPKGEGDNHDGHADASITHDGIEAQEDDDAPHVLARWHEHSLEHAQLVVMTFAGGLLLLGRRLKRQRPF
jgi:hypothetical protein